MGILEICSEGSDPANNQGYICMCFTYELGTTYPIEKLSDELNIHPIKRYSLTTSRVPGPPYPPNKDSDEDEIRLIK